jgi:hypothetical protein
MTVHDQANVMQLGNMPLSGGNGGQASTINAEIDDSTGYGDYYGFKEFGEWFFPDGKQKIEFKKLNEGDRAKFERATSKSLKMSRSTDEASLAVDTAKERHELILGSVTGWHLVTKRYAEDGSIEIVPIPFSKGSQHAELEKWLKEANPKHVSDLHAAIVEANPFMTANATPDMIREEIAKLQEALIKAEEREAGKPSS